MTGAISALIEAGRNIPRCTRRGLAARPMDRLMVYSTERSYRRAELRTRRHWPDSVFKTALIVWLVLGLTSIVKSMLDGESSLTLVLLVAWGVVVIVVLWFRLGPPADTTGGSDVIK